MTRPDPSIPHQIALQAVEWQLALQAGEAVEQDMCDWLSADERHRQAWAHIQQTNARLRLLTDPIARAAVLTPAGASRRKAVKSLMLLFFVGSGGTLLYREAPWRAALADVTTGIGERRELMLANGTRLNLNSATVVSVTELENEIRLTLFKGEILVTTAQSLQNTEASASKSLVVASEHGELRPLGTQFSVRRQDSYSQVAVFSGVVAASPSAPSGVIRNIESGQQGKLYPDRLTAVQTVDAHSLAWVDGMLVAASMPLAEFINRLRPYRSGHLSCDPALAALPVSGTYPLDDTDKVLDSLAQTLPLRIQRFTQYWVRLIPA